ncbi:hypothetical protein LJR225_001779 [Phenylobacterium sp. LjRoot225]|uniref:hypothetical protein n=1 Tax=Phenylobacterium sp. LjRoot225 TaxID=3342285 RepID=UPI003ECD26A9
MGFRGLPNCALNFGEGAAHPGGGGGAIGWLVGDIGRGPPQMFQMMNEARISVGLFAAMLAYRGYLLALDYARDRRVGGGRPALLLRMGGAAPQYLPERATGQTPAGGMGDGAKPRRA